MKIEPNIDSLWAIEAMVEKLYLKDSWQSFSCSRDFSNEVDIDMKGYGWGDWSKLWSKDYTDGKVVFNGNCTL